MTRALLAATPTNFVFAAAHPLGPVWAETSTPSGCDTGTGRKLTNLAKSSEPPLFGPLHSLAVVGPLGRRLADLVPAQVTRDLAPADPGACLTQGGISQEDIASDTAAATSEINAEDNAGDASGSSEGAQTTPQEGDDENLPAGWLHVVPLVQAIEGRGGLAACGVHANTQGHDEDDTREFSRLHRAYHRAIKAGRLTVFSADTIAIKALGMHPALVWGEEWWDAIAAPAATPIDALATPAGDVTGELLDADLVKELAFAA
jgi:hypothetical protein